MNLLCHEWRYPKSGIEFESEFQHSNIVSLLNVDCGRMKEGGNEGKKMFCVFSCSYFTCNLIQSYVKLMLAWIRDSLWDIFHILRSSFSSSITKIKNTMKLQNVKKLNFMRASMWMELKLRFPWKWKCSRLILDFSYGFECWVKLTWAIRKIRAL